MPLSPDPGSADAQADASAWGAWQELVDELAERALRATSADELADATLDRLLSGLSGVAAAVWDREPSGQFALRAQRRLATPGVDDAWREPRFRTAAFEAALEARRPLVVPPGATVGAAGLANPTTHLLVLGPILLDDESLGVIELYLPAGADEAAREGVRHLISVVGEVWAEFQRRREFRLLRAEAAAQRSFADLTARLQADWQLAPLSYTLANDGRLWVECDRLGVLVVDEGRAQVQATSGVDLVDPRSSAVRRIEELAAAVALGGEVWWYPGHPQPAPPEIEAPLAAWLSETAAQQVVVLPLREPKRGDERDQARGGVIGCLVAEWFSRQSTELGRARLEKLAPQAAAAVARARVSDRWPQAWWIRRAAAREGWYGARRRRWAATVAATAVMVGLLLAVVPAELWVSAPGHVDPVHRRRVYAPSDASVAEVAVLHGQTVAVGQLLVALRRPELELEWARLSGEIATTEVQLATVRLGRADGSDSADEDPREPGRLAARAEELAERLANLRAQLTIVEAEQKQLRVTSPLAGTVLTWNVAELLAGRPVRRGQLLVTVADLAGPWQLELEIPDDQVRHVAAARGDPPRELAVRFRLATTPELRQEGRLVEVAPATEIGDDAQGRVRAWVDFDRARLPSLRPGALTSAEIACGRRALGYVWLGRTFERLWRGW